MWTTKKPKWLKAAIPPAWTGVMFNDDPDAHCVCYGFDIAGRKQRVYSQDHVAAAKAGKFERVRMLLAEWEDIRTEIEGDLNDESIAHKEWEAALVAYLIYETAIRPGSANTRRGQVQAFGAVSLQLRHVKPCARGVRLKFTGKKGVSQNVLVTNPYIVERLLERKHDNPSWSANLFDVSSSKLNEYIGKLGSGRYTAKDFRTARGTSLALELLGRRKRIPKTKKAIKAVVNAALDKVAKTLGNTRAISKSAYVDPAILERFVTIPNSKA